MSYTIRSAMSDIPEDRWEKAFSKKEEREEKSESSQELVLPVVPERES